MKSPKINRFWSSLILGIAVLTAIGLPSMGINALAADSCQTQATGDFSIVLLPDTQNYAEKFPEIYIAQTEWIKKQQKAKNIRFVIHLGDIVQHPTVEKEWLAADRAHAVLDGAVAYSMLPGNHDMDDRDTTLYNKYFPPKRFAKNSWYAGHEGPSNENNYCIFKAAGMKFLVLSLEYSPGPDTFKWANKVLAENAGCRAIVATHSYLNRDGRNPIGNSIWEQLVRKHKNVFLVVCGHVLGKKLCDDTTDGGTKVVEMLVDYQGEPNGGDGWLRILRFSPSQNKIIVRDYSPTLEKYRDGPAANFSLEYAMSGAAKESKTATAAGK